MSSKLKIIEVKNARIELSKRQNLPVRLEEPCPKCKTMAKYDYSAGDHYASYPTTGVPADVYFCCRKCEHEWQRKLIINLSVVEAPNAG